MTGIGRASAALAVGTLLSRVTGVIRQMVLIAAIGTAAAADAFEAASRLPSTIYMIISTGLLTAVIVPQIVKSASHPDGGQRFISKLFTLGATSLLAAAGIATLAAPGLVALVGGGFRPDQLALATAFAYWVLPQIFFYGLFALLGETLNARSVFGPYAWAPIVNNLVSIAGFTAFIVMFGTASAVDDWSAERIAILAGTSTLGIVIQAGVLIPFWRRAGLSIRPDFRWKGMGLRHITKLAGWTFLMVVCTQIAGIVQSRMYSIASAAGEPANMISANASLIFMLPYSLIALSIGTPYFTRLSEHAAAGRITEVRNDLQNSIRVIGMLTLLAGSAIASAAIPLSRLLTNSAETAGQAGIVLLAYLLGLLPMSVLFTIQRTFYAYDDTRTPFFFTVVQMVITIATALAAGLLLTPEFITLGVVLGQSFAIVVQVVVAAVLLHRKIGSIAAGTWLPALFRFVLASIPAVLAGFLVFVLTGAIPGWTTQNWLTALLGSALLGGLSAVVYIAMLAAMRAPELRTGWEMVRRMLPGGGARG